MIVIVIPPLIPLVYVQCLTSLSLSFRNAFGQSFGTICLSGILVGVVRVVRAIVDNAREENPQGIVNFALRCCANALLGAFDYLNKFTINFAAITGESYCTSAKMTYELLRRNLLSAVFVETVSTRILTGIVFVLSAAYAVAVSIRQLVHLLTNQTFELLILVCYVVKNRHGLY